MQVKFAWLRMSAYILELDGLNLLDQSVACLANAAEGGLQSRTQKCMSISSSPNASSVGALML